MFLNSVFQTHYAVTFVALKRIKYHRQETPREFVRNCQFTKTFSQQFSFNSPFVCQISGQRWNCCSEEKT